MKNKFIHLGLAILAALCSSISIEAADDNLRQEFYDQVEGPRNPAKGLVALHNDGQVFAVNDGRIFSTTNGTAWTLVCEFPANDFGNVARIHSLGTHMVIQEELMVTSSHGGSHKKGRVFVLNLADSQLSKVDTGGDHDWVQDTRRNASSSIFYLNSHTYNQGQSLETCFCYDVTTGILKEVAHGSRLGNPVLAQMEMLSSG